MLKIPFRQSILIYFVLEMIDMIEVEEKTREDSKTNSADDKEDFINLTDQNSRKRKQILSDEDDSTFECQDSERSTKRVKRSEPHNGDPAENVFKIFDLKKSKKTNPKETEKSGIDKSDDDDIIVLDNNKVDQTEKSEDSHDGKPFSIHKFLVAHDPEEENYKKRKQLRKLISDEKLQLETKEAQEAERKRLERLRAKEASFIESPESFESVILESHKQTKEPLLEVDKPVAKKLKPHQIDGIKFMWASCYESLERIESNLDAGGGCILAHCMGLGKFFKF